MPKLLPFRGRRPIIIMPAVALFVIALTLVVYRWPLFSDGWLSLILTLAVFVLAPSDGVRIFNSDLIDNWIASVVLTAIPIFVWMILSRAAGKPSRSPWRDMRRQYAANRLAVVALLLLAGFVLTALLCPLIAPYDPLFQQDPLVTRLQPPGTRIPYVQLPATAGQFLPQRDGDGIDILAVNALIRVNHRLLYPTPPIRFVRSWRPLNDGRIEYDNGSRIDTLSESISAGTRTHWLGTDQFGRDILSRMIFGSRISLSVGFLAVVLAVGLGVSIGAVAGYYGGLIDSVLMRGVDLAMSFPSLFLVLLVMALFGESLILMIVVLGLTSWMGVARLTRGQILSLREQEFVLAARASGLGPWRLITRHLLPNAMAPILVAATLRLGGMILIEAGLSFLGLGVHPPTPTWGNMIDEGRHVLLQAWWISTFPGLAIAMTVIAFNIIGDGLRDALDPRLQKLL